MQEKETLLSASINAILHPFRIIHVHDYRIVMANTAHGGEQAVGQLCYAFSHGLDTPCAETEHPCPLRYVQETGQPFFAEYIKVAEAENPRNIEIRAYPIFDEQGQVKQIVEYTLDITKRRRAEIALRESEEKFRALFDQSIDGIYLHDLEGYILDVNRMACQKSGYSREELLGSSVFNGYPEHSTTNLSQAEILQAWRQWIPGQQKVIETAHQRKDGTLYPVEIATGIVRYGDATAILVTVRDITERKQAEAALRESDARLRTLFENIPIGMFQSTPEGKFVYVNPAIPKMLGYASPEELIALVNQTSIAEVLYVDPAQRPVFVQTVESAGGDWKIFDARYRCKDGHVIDAILSFNERIEPLSGQRFLYGFVQDITERKQAEKTLFLKQQELINQINLFESLLQNLRVGVFMVAAPTGKPILANDKARQLLGRGLTEVGTQDLATVYQAYKLPQRELYPIDELPIVLGMRGISSQVDDMLVIRPNGQEIQLEVFGTPIKDAQGAIWASLISFADITERKRTEKAVRESLTEKTVLLQEVHHRVKNNLAMIIGLLNLQQFTGLEPIVEAQFQEFEGRIRSIALIHEMLYQAELLSQVDFDAYLHALVVRLHDMFDPLNRIALHIAAPGIELHPDLAIPCGLIVNELVVNALKYAFPASRLADTNSPCLLSVTLEWDGTHYTLTVSDNGVGFPPEMDWRTQESLGLQLVYMLGEGQLHGQLEFGNQGGVTCRLRFTPEGV